jgi:hypothetical protein
MRKQNEQVLLYITKSVYSAYYTHLSSKDLCVFLYPANQTEIEKIDNINRSEIVYIQLKMPSWWCDWYYSLSLENRFKFALFIEQRLKEYGLI